jgi:alpha-beta hydrolase superfamily lysophospholipase
MLKLFLRLLSAVAPGLAGNVGARFWFAVRPPRVTEEAHQFLATGTRFDVRVNDTTVVGWRWGAGPTVLLMHGWGGYAGQLYHFVEPLTRAGYQVITFDAPSHGESGPGRLGPRRAILFDFSDALLAASSELTQIAGVIAHSGGCAAAAWALSKNPGWPVERMVFIAPFAALHATWISFSARSA